MTSQAHTFMVWPIHAATDAQRTGARILVWVPAQGDREGFWTFARWYSDARAPADLGAHRRDLMAQHGGYWSAHFKGGSPLPRLPTHFVDLRPLDERAERVA